MRSQSAAGLVTTVGAHFVQTRPWAMRAIAEPNASCAQSNSRLSRIRGEAPTKSAPKPKATECLVRDCDVLSTFDDFIDVHWLHIRTKNPIESTSSTVRLLHTKTKGSGSRAECLTPVFKLVESASKNR